MAKKQNDSATVTEQTTAPDTSLAHDSANAPVSLRSVMLDAFKLGESAERDGVRSQQTLAYACMRQHFMDQQSNAKPASWSAIHVPAAKGSPNKAAADFTNRMIGVAYPPTADDASKSSNLDASAVLDKDLRQARYVSLRRAVTLAAQLVLYAECTHLDYDEAKKVFRVPVSALLLDGQIPFGNVWKENKQQKTSVLLDGTRYTVLHEANPDKLHTIKADVPRIVDVVLAKTAKENAEAVKKNVDAVKAGALSVGQSATSTPPTTQPTADTNSAPSSTAPAIAAATVHGGAIADVQAADRATRQNKVGTTGDLWDCLREASAIIMAVENTHHNRVAWREIPLDVQNALVNIELFIAQAKADDAMPADGHRDEPVMGVQPVTADVPVTEPETAAIAA